MKRPGDKAIPRVLWEKRGGRCPHLRDICTVSLKMTKS